MSHVKNYNHDLFNLAEDILKKLGFVVISPAHLPINLSYEAYLDFGQLSVSHCDFVYQLPGTDKSRGASFLKLTAEIKKTPVYCNLSSIPAMMFEDNKPPVYALTEQQDEIDKYCKKDIV